MATTNRTMPTKIDLQEYLNGITDTDRHTDCTRLAQLMNQATGQNGVLWGNAMVGFGDHHYVYESGREGDWFQIGFSNKKASITIYTVAPLDAMTSQLEKLGSLKTGVGCLHLKRLAEVDEKLLLAFLREAVEQARLRAKPKLQAKIKTTN